VSDNLVTRTADPMDRLAHDTEDPNPCPPLTAAEYEALKRSIQDDGFIPAFPVLISAGPAFPGRIIDGHHRSQVCAELGIQPVVLHHPCATDLEFRILQIKANLERRQLSTAQRAMLAVRLLPLYEEKAADARWQGRRSSADAG
jgi:ParB-like chromosome segregation protein Spo0J